MLVDLEIEGTRSYLLAMRKGGRGQRERDGVGSQSTYLAVRAVKGHVPPKSHSFKLNIDVQQLTDWPKQVVWVQ